MFLVCDEYGIFTVYGVRENKDGVIEFLLYDTEGWGWSEAYHYEPYNPDSEDEVIELI
jgi:hypothetical protein